MLLIYANYVHEHGIPFLWSGRGGTRSSRLLLGLLGLGGSHLSTAEEEGKRHNHKNYAMHK